MSTQKHRTTPLIILALILLAAIPFAVQHTKKETNQTEKNSRSRLIQIASKDSANRKNQTTRRPSRPVQPLLNHKPEELQHFFLPAVELKNTTFSEAMDTLIAQYRKTCQETGETPLDFKWSIEGNPDPIVSLILKGDFLSDCKLLAAIAGLRLEQDGSTFTFSEFVDSSSLARRWTIPPNFTTWLEEIALLDNAPENTMQIGAQFKELGLVDEGGSFNILTNTLIIRGGGKNHFRFDEILKAAPGRNRFQTLLNFSTDQGEAFSPFSPHQQLSTLQHKNAGNGDLHDLQILFVTNQHGFTTDVRAFSYTGPLPKAEAQNLFNQTGNVNDLGIEGTETQFTISRNPGESPQRITLRDITGTPHELNLTSTRIDTRNWDNALPSLEEE